MHHQYPGTHWTKHPKLLTKHMGEYVKSYGSVFYGTHTFEMLALIIMADYEKLADRFLGNVPELFKSWVLELGLRISELTILNDVQ